ncbi:MAG: matrixin family metalloprotease, partial [Myxococcota bacterium]|nr:matrixin family metalloprotease [Myxococcota bacterium]
EYQGIQSGHYGWTTDGTNKMYYDDPAETAGSGVLGVTYCTTTGGYAFELNGMAYYYTYDCDIVYNNDVAWASTEDIEGSCSNEYSIESVATHETGHLWGEDHSCEEDDVCAEDDLRWATMYWSAPSCSAWQVDINDDDIEGITALYGPYATFDTTDDRYGGVPLDVCFELVSNDVVSDVSWAFGDGTECSWPEDADLETCDWTTTEGDTGGTLAGGVCHTYEDQGQYTVTVGMGGEGEACGEWDYTYRELAYVLACEAPHMAEGLEGMFTYEHYDGLIYQMINQADTTVYGCIDQVQWDVFKGDELVQSVSAWTPKIEFAEEGTYRVVLNLGGPGGYAAEELTIEVVDEPGESSGGCATAPGAAGAWGILVGLGVAVGRRRRR